MIRLEGDTLPLEARGAIPPILFGDLCRDVPGIPLQIGWAATLASNCGIDASTTTLYLGGADLAEVLAAVPTSGVVQLENEWMTYSAILSAPPRLTISARGYRSTVPAVHPKGTTVYFVETRPVYVLAYVPPGCTYPDDMLVQLRVNDNAETPPCTVRLQDTRLVPGVRLVTVEFDASKAFYAQPAVALPAQAVLIGPDFAARGRGTGVLRQGGPPAIQNPAMRLRLPPPPRIRTGGGATPYSGNGGQRVVSLRQGALGRVTADLKGLRDTSAGRYSGVALGGLVQPAAIVRLLLEETYGETDPALYHPLSWAATAAAHAALGLTWRLVWRTEAFETFREAAQACGQADLYVDDAGRWRYAYRDPAQPAVGTLTRRELLDEPAVAWTAGRDVITELEVAWGEGVQGGTLTLESDAMRLRHGRNHGGLALPYAATEALARTLSTRVLAQRERPRQTVTVRTAHPWLGLAVTDRVYVDTPLLALYGAPAVPYEIVGITDRGDARVLALLEGDPLPPPPAPAVDPAVVTVVADWDDVVNSTLTLTITPGADATRLVYQAGTTAFFSTVPGLTSVIATPVGGGTAVPFTAHVNGVGVAGAPGSRVFVWSGAGAVPGTPYDVVATWTGNLQVAHAVIALAGIGSVGTPGSDVDGNATGTATVNTGGGAALVLDLMRDNAGATYTPGGGQTALYTAVTGGGQVGLAGSWLAGTGALTPSIVTTSGGGNAAYAAVPFLP